MPEAVATRMAELEPEVTVAGLKVTLTPGGVPVAVRDTCWALPATVVVVTVAAAVEPASTLPLAGLRASEKSVSCRAQVGSPLWAGMSIAFQAALVASNRSQDASRFLAAVRVAERYRL